MEISSEFKKILSEPNSHRTMRLTFRNGEIIEGFVSKFTIGDFKNVTITKSRVNKGESPLINVDFSLVTEIEVTHQDGSIKTFS